MFVELKAPGKEPTDLQKKKIKELSGLGQKVFVADTREKVDKLIEYCTDLIGR